MSLCWTLTRTPAQPLVWNAALAYAATTSTRVVRLDGATLTGCDLRGASLRGAWAGGAVFERCDLRGVVHTGADLTGATFRACKIAGTRGKPATTEG
jgi:uncharacterized protein YjbI with pentapeptide repeats